MLNGGFNMIEEKYFTCAVDKELYKKLKLYCIENNVKLKDFINDAIKEKLEK